MSKHTFSTAILLLLFTIPFSLGIKPAKTGANAPESAWGEAIEEVYRAWYYAYRDMIIGAVKAKDKDGLLKATEKFNGALGGALISAHVWKRTPPDRADLLLSTFFVEKPFVTKINYAYSIKVHVTRLNDCVQVESNQNRDGSWPDGMQIKLVFKSPVTAPTKAPWGKAVEGFAARIRTVLPKGWSVNTDGSMVTVKRDEEVRGIHLSPLAPGPNERKWTVTIKVRVGSRISKLEYCRLASQNEAVRKKEQARRGPHYTPVDNPIRLPHSLPTHFQGENSLWISGWIPLSGSFKFTSEQVGRECRGVHEAIKGLFRAYTTPRLLWGSAVEGVQVRLRADKLKWKTDETPAFKADVHNGGRRELYYVPGRRLIHELEVDGRWYRDMSSVRRLAYSPIRPGDERQGIRVSLGQLWHRSQAPRNVELAPGKHTIRVAFNGSWENLFKNKNAPQVRVISNPVEIEILP